MKRIKEVLPGRAEINIRPDQSFRNAKINFLVEIKKVNRDVRYQRSQYNRERQLWLSFFTQENKIERNMTGRIHYPLLITQKALKIYCTGESESIANGA